MANTRILIYYLLFLVFFSFFVSGFGLSDSEVTLSDFGIVTKMVSKLNDSSGLVASVLKVVLFPFIIFDALFIIIGMFTITFISLPMVFNVLLFAPIGVIVTIDYIIPIIRGN